MSLQKKYDKVVKLQETLKASPKVASFLDIYKQELLSLFDDAALSVKKPTKKILLDLLDAKQSNLALELQSAHLKKGLHDGNILPLKAALERKKKEELAESKYLHMILQLACSHPEYYFRKNFDSKTSHKELIDYVVIDPNMVPQGFLDEFQIESMDIDGKNIKELFKKARPLNYHKEKSETTRRVVFIDGKLVVFRELQQLLHKERNLTQGEKRRIDYKKYFNTFSDIYSALRSQQHIVDKQEGKIDDYKIFQKTALELIQDLKGETKHREEKKKLDEIMDGIANATSFPLMASKFYNLFKIDFVNKSIAANHVVGASNKISEELHALRSIILEIQLQSDALQQLLETQKYTLQMFHTKLSLAIKEHDGPSFVDVVRSYYTQLSNIPQKTHPFTGFAREIREVFGNLYMVETMERNKALLKSKILLALQKMRLQAYQLEHKIKLGTATKHDFAFDVNISKKYPDLHASFFGNISEYMNKIQNLRTSDMSQENMDICVSLLQQLKALPDWEADIQALKTL